MARVTVEDCLDKVDNRFDLVLIATKRARELSRGTKEPHVSWDEDKSTVVALREIAGGFIGRDYLDVEEEPVVREHRSVDRKQPIDFSDDVD